MVLNDKGLYILDGNNYMPYKIPNDEIIMCGVPAAFTPTCTENHLSQFGKHIDELPCKVIFFSVNDPSVMHEWNKRHGHEKIDAIADPLATFTKSIGKDIDFGEAMGVRCKRFAMFVKNRKVIKFYDNPFIEGVLNDH